MKMNKEWKYKEMVTMQAGGLLLIRHEWRLSRYTKKSNISKSAIRC